MYFSLFKVTDVSQRNSSGLAGSGSPDGGSPRPGTGSGVTTNPAAVQAALAAFQAGQMSFMTQVNIVSIPIVNFDCKIDVVGDLFLILF